MDNLRVFRGNVWLKWIWSRVKGQRHSPPGPHMIKTTIVKAINLPLSLPFNNIPWVLTSNIFTCIIFSQLLRIFWVFSFDQQCCIWEHFKSPGLLSPPWSFDLILYYEFLVLLHCDQRKRSGNFLLFKINDNVAD